MNLGVVLMTIHVDVHAILLHERHEEVLELRSAVVANSDGKDC